MPVFLPYLYYAAVAASFGTSVARSAGAFDDDNDPAPVGSVGSTANTGSAVTDVGNVAAASATESAAGARQERAGRRAEQLAISGQLSAAERSRLDRLRASKAARGGRGSTILSTATGLTGDTSGAQTLLGG